MKTLKFYLILSLVMLLNLVSCKKGEEDPFLSLRTRKSRLTGEWKVSYYDYKEYSKNGEVLYSESFDGTNIKDEDGFLYSYSSEFTFEKNGTYQNIIINDGETSTEKGNWIFVGKNKDLDVKKREYLMLNETSYTIGDYHTTNTNLVTDESVSYKLIKLSNKEIIMSYSYEEDSFVGGYSKEEGVLKLIKK